VQLAEHEHHCAVTALHQLEPAQCKVVGSCMYHVLFQCS